MANIKFSQFTVETDINNFDDIVGYAGASNVRITPANLITSLESSLDLANLSGVLPIAKGGTSASNGQDALDNLTAQIVGYGTVQDNDIIVFDAGTTGVEWKPLRNVTGYWALQVFVWTPATAGGVVNYNNWTQGTAWPLPFDASPISSVYRLVPAGGLSTYIWTNTTGPNGLPGAPVTEKSTFELGANGAGSWRVKTMQNWFDQINDMKCDVKMVINGTDIISLIAEESDFNPTDNRMMYGEVVQLFAAGDTVEFTCEFNSTGAPGTNPFPADVTNRPIEVSFEKLSA